MRGRLFAVIALVAVAALGGILAATAAAGPSCTDTYTNAVTTGDWATPANWSTGKVPTSSDVACWASNQTLTVTSSGDAADSIQGGALTISTGDLFVASSTNDSSVTALTINGGALNGGGRTLSVAGDFDWNVPNGASSALFGSSALNIVQTGSHSFKIEGAGTESMSRGSFSTPNPVSITDTNFSPGNFPGPTLTTTSTVTFGAGSYSGGNFTMTATGIVTPAGAVSTQYSLDLTGNSSDVKGDLTLAGLSSDAGTTLSIPVGHVLTAGGGTISGTVDGLGSYIHDGTAQDIASGGKLSPASVTITSGKLTLDQGGTYAPPGTTTIGANSPSGAALELDDNGSTGGLTLTQGSLTGTSGSVLTVAGDFDWNTPSGGSSGINTSPQGLTVSQTGTHLFNIQGSGTAAIDGGALTTSNPVSITDTNFFPANFPGPTLTTTSTVSFAAGTYAGGNFAMTAAGIVTPGVVSTQYSLDLTGSSSSLGGDLTLAALGTETAGQLTIPSGDTVHAGGGTIKGTVDGAGTFDQNGGPTTVASGGSLATGAVTVTAGQLIISSGAGYSTGSTTIGTVNPGTPGRLEVDDSNASTGPLTITGGGFNGPSLIGSGKLTVDGDFDWNTPSGGVSAIGDADPRTLTVEQTPAHSFKIEGPGSEFMDGGTLTTPNPVTISNPNFSPGNFPGPSLTTTSTVTFTNAGSYPGGNLTLTAAGVNLAAGDTTLHYTFDLTGGATTIPNGSTLTADQVNESGGTLQVDGTLSAPVDLSGGTLKGAGTISGSLTNTAGTVAPGDSPGTLHVSSDYTQGSGGTLAEEITGTTPGAQFDQLVVGGNVSLDGTLAIDSHTFTPANTDTFKIISGATSRNGTFATLTGATVNGQTYQAQYDSDGVTLGVQPPPAPSNNGLPVISGTPTQGQTLHTTNGSWDNNPSSFDYQWEDCDNTGANCTNTGSDSSAYTLTGNDVGHTIRVVVTAHNPGGSGQATADPTAPVVPLAPSNTGLPVISGTATQGQTLQTTNGSWDNNPTSFHYQWSDCDAAGANCTNTGTDSSSYTLTGSDVGHTITVAVTAINAGGQGQATANHTPAVAALAPTNTSPPTISGTPAPEQALTCGNGTWSPAPTSFTYQWNRDGSAIFGATNDTYVVTAQDRGHTLTCSVTAFEGGAASSPATSAGVSSPAPAPVNTSPPTITGTPLPGNTLTCHPGTWTGNPTSFDYQWDRDSSQIPGATQPQYKVQIADEGHGLGCDVGADNGSAASSATASAPVIVAMKGTLNCPKPSGQISGLSVGPLALGMKRARARAILHRFAVTRNHFDDFCLFGGWGIRVAYPPSRLLAPLGRARGGRLHGKIVIALTANPFYSLDGVAPGASLQLARSKLRLGKVFHIGLNDWYVASRPEANGVLKVRGGIVQEAGLVNKQLTATRRAQSRLLISFR